MNWPSGCIHSVIAPFQPGMGLRLRGKASRCCDDSPNKHATAHFHATGHPVIEGYDPPEGWGWCFVDEVLFDLSDRMTPHNGPIPRYY